MSRTAVARLVRFVRTRDTRSLVLVRGIRSISQGALVVDFALYLRALHWSAGAIGALLTASMATGIVLTAVFGPLSDRIGRRRFLLGFETTRMVAAAMALASSDVRLIVVAALLGQYGRGGTGSAGPFGAVEQAWLSHSVPREERVGLYSLNSAMGFLGQGTGALLAALPAVLAAWLPGALAFRPLFGLAGVTSVIAFLLIRRIPDAPAAPRPPREPVPVAARPAPTATHQENRLLARLVLANLLHGAAAGLSGPLVAYWFAVQYGHGPGFIGPIMASGFVLSALASMLTGRLAQRFGIVPVVIGMRTVGLGMLAALPLAPGLGAAGGLYALGSLFDRGTNGARAALSMGLVRPERRGFAAALSSVSVSLPRAAGPSLAGAMFESRFLALPFLLAAGLQAAHLSLYAASFARHERSSGSVAAGPRPGFRASPARGGAGQLAPPSPRRGREQTSNAGARPAPDFAVMPAVTAGLSGPESGAGH